MTEWEERFFFAVILANKFQTTIDFLKFEMKKFFHASVLAPLLLKSTIPKNTAVDYIRINSHLSHESMIEGEVKQDFAVVRVQVVPSV